MRYTLKKQLKALIIISVFVLLTIIAATSLEFDILEVIVNFSASVDRVAELYWPLDLSEILNILKQLWLTIIIALSGAFVGMIGGLFGALAISKTTARNKIVAIIVRTIASLTRNIPAGVWSIILLQGFWYGEFLGFIVMAIASFGFLTRTFADSIDETNTHAIEALEATGASYWQIIIHAIIPESLPSLISWSLFGIENNVRDSTIVGMLAGGGIGYLINNYKHFGHYQLLATAIIAVVIIVILTDQISAQIRKRILS